MTYCGEQTFVKYGGENREATTLRCRAWTCPDCANGRKAQLIAQAHRGRGNTFITLTVRRHQYANPELAAQALAQAWRLIVKRAVRERSRDTTKHPLPFGAAPATGWGDGNSKKQNAKVRFEEKNLEYLCVIEAHQSGWPHLHIITRCAWFDVEWLKAQTQEILNSPVVFVQRILRKSQVNAYVAKYCSKCEHKFGTTKRYWQSKNFQLTKYEKPNKEVFPWDALVKSKFSAKHFAKAWEAEGWSINWTKLWHCEARPPDG